MLKWLFSLSLASLVFAFQPAAAQDAPFPKRGNIEITVLFPAGSSADVTAGLLAQGMSKQLGANVIIVNRPGAGGAIGYKYVASQKPDGYALVWNSNSVSTTFHSGQMNIDYRTFDPVARVVSALHFSFFTAKGYSCEHVTHKRPRASKAMLIASTVLRISTVCPDIVVTMSPGRVAPPPGMFSQAGTTPTTFTGARMPASARSDLKPVYSFNSRSLWGVPGAQGGQPGERLPAWQDLLRRAKDEGFD